MSDVVKFNEASLAVYKTVAEAGPDGIEVGEVAKLRSLDQAFISSVVTKAAVQGHFKVKEREREELIVSENARELIESGLPEIRAAEKLAECDGHLAMPRFIEWAKSAGVAVNEVFKWGGVRGWIDRAKDADGPNLVLTPAGKRGLENFDADLRLLKKLDFQGTCFLDELSEAEEPSRVREFLQKRPDLAKIKKRTERILSITDAGKTILEPGNHQLVLERNTLTPEDLESGAWREITLRPYDVTLAAQDIHPAKIHPLRKIIEQTRRAFLEMGFAEVVSPMVESAFWNFDALFQPQDHPARDMQDTFYMADPATAPLPDQSIVEPVRRTHEDGWETGSEGWGYTWSPERSKQVVLRTHTTAATIRALARNPDPPGKFFCVGWTYRNETISFKHLPVFHQVDGIVIDEEANLASLLGTLQEFYSKMGFGRVKFKPAFYPYTEPSVDVVVYMESRKKWLEMGGAGIFRPEVTLPLGCKYPVLAWGLGIERLAMLRFGLDDIRDLYRSNLDALEGVPLCR